jgi:propionyl-CoA synthetase
MSKAGLPRFDTPSEFDRLLPTLYPGGASRPSNRRPQPMSGDTYSAFHRRSVLDPDGFWGEQADLIDWETAPSQVLDYSDAPFARWFVGGTTNLCHNAIDRHAALRPDAPALIYVSSETGAEQTFTFAEMHREVQRVAAMFQRLGVGRGDRVLIYMPMVPEAVLAMLACVRIGAIHSVVFGGFASVSLAARIDDAAPKIVVSADAGSRGGKVTPYKNLLDQAIAIAKCPPEKVLLIDRQLAAMQWVDGRDVAWASLARECEDAMVPCTWLESSEPSYILYTSGTTGLPKGVQRDTGGYAVALAASMKWIYCGGPGDTYFSTSDIGWVVGHSYIVYAPLIAGMATLMYEGLPIRPDAGIWWSLVERYRVNVMFTAPTALRILKKHDPAFMTGRDISSLRALFVAGEPFDEPTAQWISKTLGKPIIDNYWQTETGWPMISVQRGVDKDMQIKPGSPGLPVYGYQTRIVDEVSGDELPPDAKGVLMVEGPLPPGCMTTVWRDDARYLATYWTEQDGRWFYTTFDWCIQDRDGYLWVLGRTDDVINVAGHRLGTREIEESVSAHPNVAECAVVGVADAVKGQVAIAFVILKSNEGLEDLSARLGMEGEIMATVGLRIGAVGRPARVYFVNALPKTRSGKILRRAIQAVCEERAAGDLTTIEDPAALDQLRLALHEGGQRHSPN